MFHRIPPSANLSLGRLSQTRAAIKPVYSLALHGIRANSCKASYTPDETTWVKIKNRAYSQAVGRKDFFDRRRA
jgi:hypothetical protein